MPAFVGIWAKEPKAYESPWFYLGMLALLGCLFLGFALMVAARRWLQHREESPSPTTQLAEFEMLYLQGEISREELEQIRSRFQAPAQAPVEGKDSGSPPEEKENRADPPLGTGAPSE
jgi:hypothetical protein